MRFFQIEMTCFFHENLNAAQGHTKASEIKIFQKKKDKFNSSDNTKANSNTLFKALQGLHFLFLFQKP